jgi:hypothetical protein
MAIIKATLKAKMQAGYANVGRQNTTVAVKGN